MQRVPALRGFWDFKRTPLREICISGTSNDFSWFIRHIKTHLESFLIIWSHLSHEATKLAICTINMQRSLSSFCGVSDTVLHWDLLVCSCNFKVVSVRVWQLVCNWMRIFLELWVHETFQRWGQATQMQGHGLL